MSIRRQIPESEGAPRTFASCLRIAIMAMLLAGLAWVAPVLLAADKDQTLEYQVKAAFLLNFTKFIEWPAIESPADAPFSICILGPDPFGTVIDRIVEGETVNGRKLAIERVAGPPPRSCQIVFAGRSEKSLSNLLAGLGPGVLTVGEGESFLREGGMIAFVLENRHVRFEVNLRRATASALKISSKLLNVARAVEK